MAPRKGYAEDGHQLTDSEERAALGLDKKKEPASKTKVKKSKKGSK